MTKINVCGFSVFTRLRFPGKSSFMVIKLFYLSKTESEMAISCVSCWKESYHQQISGLNTPMDS